MQTILQIPQAAQSPSAGGAEIAQVVLATALITGLFGFLAIAVLRHRAGKGTILSRAADAAERASGLPGWASLPIGVATVSLIVALTGMYWDISIHIDNGRDAGPLANIAHYPILLGLMGVFAAGWLAIFLPPRGTRPGPAPIRLGSTWFAPVGGVLIFLCGGFSLVGFPLDDVWHRIFGQDVTLWGPTHLMLLGGAAMTLVGQAILLTEGAHSAASSASRPGAAVASALVRARRIGICGGLLIGVSIYQAEFDFGVPQFRMVFEPAMLALASGFALTTARMWIGRGGALYAALFFLVVRGVVSIWTGPIMGQTTPMVPLYLVEALLVEGLAFTLIARRDLNPLAFGAIAGLACGTVGFGAQWLLSDLYMPIPWTADVLPEGLIMAVVAGVAGGVLGGLLASGLRAELPSRRTARTAFALSMLALVAVIANGLMTEQPGGTNATIAVDPTSGGSVPEAEVSVRFDPVELRRGRIVGDGHLVAGGRPRGHRAEASTTAGGRGRLAQRRPRADRRRVEVDASGADGPRARERAGLPARRRGDPGTRGPRSRPRRSDARSRERQGRSPARGEDRRRGLALGRCDRPYRAHVPHLPVRDRMWGRPSRSRRQRQAGGRERLRARERRVAQPEPAPVAAPESRLSPTRRKLRLR